jgi:hypothetical protein
MAATVVNTLTGKTGPASSVSAISLPGITAINFQIARGVVSVTYGNGQIFDMEYTGLTTVTDSISGTVSTFVMS